MNYRELAIELFVNMRKIAKMPIQKKIGEISHGEMRILGHLISENDGVSAGELSEKLDLTTPRVASALNSLAKKGFIERSRNPIDKRIVIVNITAVGKKIMLERREEAISMAEMFLEKLGEKDATELIRIMKRINEIKNQSEL